MTNQNRAKEVAIKIDSVSKDFNLPHEVDNNLKQKLLHPLKRNSTEKQHAYKTLLREQQKIENQVRRTASLQKGEYVKSIDMGTMATKTQLEAWQRLGDEMKRLEQLAASKGKKIVVNDSELTKARNLTNELSQQQRIENEIAAAEKGICPI